VWQVVAGIDLDALVDGVDRVRPRQRRVERAFVMTNVQERTQLDREVAAFDEP
jgi:hypothetical protein